MEFVDGLEIVHSKEWKLQLLALEAEAADVDPWVECGACHLAAAAWQGSVSTGVALK